MRTREAHAHLRLPSLWAAVSRRPLACCCCCCWLGDNTGRSQVALRRAAHACQRASQASRPAINTPRPTPGPGRGDTLGDDGWSVCSEPQQHVTDHPNSRHPVLRYIFCRVLSHARAQAESEWRWILTAWGEHFVFFCCTHAIKETAALHSRTPLHSRRHDTITEQRPAGHL